MIAMMSKHIKVKCVLCLFSSEPHLLPPIVERAPTTFASTSTAQAQPSSAHCAATQLLRRVLYVWAVRHMASSYVQGLAEILGVIFIVFYSEKARIHSTRKEKLLPQKYLFLLVFSCKMNFIFS